MNVSWDQTPGPRGLGRAKKRSLAVSTEACRAAAPSEGRSARGHWGPRMALLPPPDSDRIPACQVLCESDQQPGLQRERQRPRQGGQRTPGGRASRRGRPGRSWLCCGPGREAAGRAEKASLEVTILHLEFSPARSKKKSPRRKPDPYSLLSAVTSTVTLHISKL